MEQEKNEQVNTSNKGHVYTNEDTKALFGKHMQMSFILKKTEKIATAVYMVTDFLADSEPLRIQLRTVALGVVSTARKIAARSSEPHYVLADEIARLIEEMEMLITLAMTIGLVSEMNAKILISELQKVATDIEKLYGEKKVSIVTHPGYANIVLQETFFDVERSPLEGPVFHKGQLASKGHEAIHYSTASIAPAVQNATRPQMSVTKKTDLGNKIARRNDVLTIIRTKKKVSIKDISALMTDMSEKTIQRELLALVTEGVLVKEGEKRWSTYRIASQADL